MFAAVKELRSQASALAASLDPHALTPADAARVLEELTVVEKLVCGARLRLAGRAAESQVWRTAGDRTPAHWVARLCGISIRDAVAMLRTAGQLDALPVTDKALSQGQLSADQVGEIADAATEAPAAEADLLGSAKRDGFAGLRAKAKRAKAAACPNPDTGRKRAHARRAITTWTQGQEWFAKLNSSVDQGARIEAHLKPFFEAELERARLEGRREKLTCYHLDALETMASTATAARDGSGKNGRDSDGGDGEATAGRRQPKVQLILLATLAAIARGHLEPGEMCEIDGLGPVPVEVAREALGDAALSIVITDGVAVRNVTRHSRHWSPEQRTALLVEHRTCAIEGCHSRVALEIHHTIAYEDTLHSRVAEAARVCRPHHRRLTYDGYDLARRPDGTYQLLTPDQVAARRGTDPPRPEPASARAPAHQPTPPRRSEPGNRAASAPPGAAAPTPGCESGTGPAQPSLDFGLGA